MYLKLIYQPKTTDGLGIIERSKKAYELVKEYNEQNGVPFNGGVAHNFAEAVALVYENIEENSKIKEEYLMQAKEAIDKVIDQDEYYAKYYCTKGRILGLLGDYDRAKASILKAIEYEKATQKDYAIRLGEYQHFLLLLNYRKHSHSLEQMQEQLIDSLREGHRELEKKLRETENLVNEKLQENTTKNLEFLGFFVAIISFILGSIQIIKGQSFDHTVRLLGILMSSVLTVFSGFGIVLHGFSKKSLSSIIVGAISIIAAGILYWV